MKDYYKILEVHKEASPEIIAKVYKLLAKKYHPDLQDDSKKSEAAEKFKEISEAYEILSNAQKRKEYDEQLESSNQQNYVDINDYETLRGYCIQLEKELNDLNNSSSNSTYTENSFSSFSSQNSNQQTEQEMYTDNIYRTQQEEYNDNINRAKQKAYTDAVNRAYHDAYINNLRNLGYNIRYKKTFKENLKNLLALLITGLVLFIVFKILWTIPSCKEYIISLFTI